MKKKLAKDKFVRRHYYIKQEQNAEIIKSAKASNVTESEIVRTIFDGVTVEDKLSYKLLDN